MWCCLFLTILQNEIQDFVPSFELSTLGSERVNGTVLDQSEWSDFVECTASVGKLVADRKCRKVAANLAKETKSSL